MGMRKSEGEENARRGKKLLAKDLGEHMGTMLRSNVPQLATITFIIVIRWVTSENDVISFTDQLPVVEPNVSHWEKVIDFINTNGSVKEPYNPILMIRCTMKREELYEDSVGLYIH